MLKPRLLVGKTILLWIHVYRHDSIFLKTAQFHGVVSESDPDSYIVLRLSPDDLEFPLPPAYEHIHAVRPESFPDTEPGIEAKPDFVMVWLVRLPEDISEEDFLGYVRQGSQNRKGVSEDHWFYSTHWQVGPVPDIAVVTENEDISVERPLELDGERMVIRVRMHAGGRQLELLARGIGVVEDNDLVVEVKPWLAEKLKIGVGDIVVIDNAEGKFVIRNGEASVSWHATSPIH